MQFAMQFSPSTYWLMAGAVLIGLEIMVLPGIGALFSGLGALTVGAALIAGVIETQIAQFTLFFLATGIWTVLLWKPLKQFIKGKGTGFDDMVGSTAVVYGNPLVKGKKGQVRWSGTIMNCQLDLEESESVDVGSEVTIAQVSQGLLIVRTGKLPDLPESA